MSVKTLRLIASIIGPGSASQAALDELAKRKAAGEDAVCLSISGCDTLFVGSRKDTGPSGATEDSQITGGER